MYGVTIATMSNTVESLQEDPNTEHSLLLAPCLLAPRIEKKKVKTDNVQRVCRLQKTYSEYRVLISVIEVRST